MQGHLRQTGPSEEFWQNMVLEEEMQPAPVFLLWEHHEQYEKVKRCDTRRWQPPGHLLYFYVFLHITYYKPSQNIIYYTHTHTHNTHTNMVFITLFSTNL